MAHAEEDRVDHEEDPGSLGEQNSGEEQTKPEGNFQYSHESHAGIIVLLDETSDTVRKTRRLVRALRLR